MWSHVPIEGEHLPLSSSFGSSRDVQLDRLAMEERALGSSEPTNSAPAFRSVNEKHAEGGAHCQRTVTDHAI